MALGIFKRLPCDTYFEKLQSVPTFLTYTKSLKDGYLYSAFLASFSPVVRPLDLALEGVQLPLQVLQWSEGPKGPKFKQNKNKTKDGYW